uniref:COP9 signalosome complex subunit 6 n=1 Tax=Calcidiscus leptoporus TaxID=127549 RepID=A0A7S0IIX7_9EUKA
MADASHSLNITLHPLVVINISDHFTRAKAQRTSDGTPLSAEPPRVFGAVLGEQTGRQVELANSFELKASLDASGGHVIDLGYLRQRLEQYKKTFPRYDMLGWYSTVVAEQPGDLQLQQQLCEVNDSLLYLCADLTCTAGRELPMTLYESEVALINDAPTMRFSKVAYKVDSVESERIAVDHVAHILPSGDSNSSSALAQHMGGQYTAIAMLGERIDVIVRYLRAVASKQVPMDHELLRQIKSLCSRLPALTSSAFRDEFLQEQNTALLITYISAITKGIGSTNEVIDKFNVAFDKHARRRGIF